jgi:hypothetical protein
MRAKTQLANLTLRIGLRHKAAARWLCATSPVVPLLVAACSVSVSAQQGVHQAATNIAAVSRVAEDCRSRIGSNPDYRRLASHIPLGSVFDATLSQMTDTSLASRSDVISLGLWLRNLDDCRHEVIRITLRDLPTALAILVTTWNKDDEAFVLVATQKLAWGKAIMAIRTSHAEMLNELVRQAQQVAQQASAERQAELSRRIALFSAFTNLVP